MNRILSVAMFGLHQANVEGSTAGGTPAISPETLAHIPQDVKNAMQPAGRNWAEAGKQLVLTIQGAEQGIVAAEESLNATRLSGLKELAAMEDEVSRSQYITGANLQFAVVDGDKIKKTHQNYIGELRRVSAFVKANGTEAVLTKLTVADKTYPQIVADLPKATNRGASGSSGTSSQAGVTSTIREETKDMTTDQKKLLAERTAKAAQDIAAEIKGGVLSKPAPAPTKAGGAARDELVQKIAFCHEDDIEAIVAACANRCKASPSPAYQNIGAAMIDLLDTLSTEEIEKDKVEAHVKQSQAGGALPMSASN